MNVLYAGGEIVPRDSEVPAPIPAAGVDRGRWEATFVENDQLTFLAIRGEVGRLEELLRLFTFTPDTLNFAFCCAARNNHLDFARRLWAEGVISDKTLGEGLYACSDLAVINFLLDRGRPICREDLEYAVHIAAACNRLEVLDRLLRVGPISEERQRGAVDRARENGFPDAADMVLRRATLI